MNKHQINIHISNICYLIPVSGKIDTRAVKTFYWRWLFFKVEFIKMEVMQ